MSYEGFEQLICPSGHYWEGPDRLHLPAESEPCCEICRLPPIWWNDVDNTNCDQAGFIPIKLGADSLVARPPSPHKGVWMIFAGTFQTICRQFHHYEAPCMPDMSGRQVIFFFPRCPHCNNSPLWTNNVEQRVEVKTGDDNTVVEMPAFDQGVWDFIEGCEHVRLSDLAEVFGLTTGKLLKLARQAGSRKIAPATEEFHPHEKIVTIEEAEKLFLAAFRARG